MRQPNDEMCPVEALVPYANNSRTHTPKQIEQIARSIERFGFTNPVLIGDDMQIIAGHGRVEAAKLLGMSKVPVRYLSHLSGDERRAYILADNKLAENAGWDANVLAIELQGLIEVDFDLDIVGFSTTEIDLVLDGQTGKAGEADPVLDAVPDAVDGPSVTLVGDLWQLGDHRLLCGDARSTKDVACLCDGEPMAMLFTDPPYNVPIGGHVCGLALEQQLSELIGIHLEQAIPRELIRDPNVELIRKLGHRIRHLRSKPKMDYCQIILSCLERADIKPGAISITLCLEKIAVLFDIDPDRLNPDMLSFISSFQFRKRGVETKLIIGDTALVNIDTVLIRNIALAHAIYEDIKLGNDIDSIAKEFCMSKRRMLQLMDHAFLAPQIVKCILEGRQPIGLTTEWLQRNIVPICWKEQESLVATL